MQQGVTHDVTIIDSSTLLDIALTQLDCITLFEFLLVFGKKGFFGLIGAVEKVFSK